MPDPAFPLGKAGSEMCGPLHRDAGAIVPPPKAGWLQAWRRPAHLSPRRSLAEDGSTSAPWRARGTFHSKQ